MTPLHLFLLHGPENVPERIWNSRSGREYRRDLERLGLADPAGQAYATDRGLDWLEAAAKTPLPTEIVHR